ncbi:MAG TPA: NlpC/P60 family protein [Bacteroidia bacterium]|jgi:lipoprotein Spr|nr:NlpC/P60 family protein [Bacteroidia bacterium]
MKYLKRHIFIICIFVSILSACRSHKQLSSTENKDGKASTTRPQQIKKSYAALLGVDENKIENVALYTLIDDWYGTNYKYGGCSKDGIDCSNFAGIIYQEIYKKKLTGSSAAIFNQCIPVKKDELQEGDLLFFKIEKNTISHIGVYLQNNKFVHATTKKGVMINDLNETYYKTYFFKGGRTKLD